MRIDLGGDKRSRYLRAVPYGVLGLVVGAGMGFTIYIFVRGLGGQSIPVLIPLATVLVGTAMYVFGLVVIEGAGEVFERLYLGGPTPTRPQYSQAQSLVARGLYDDAVTAYTRAAAEHPTDPEPRLRLARLFRDELQRYDDAVAWFERVREIEDATPDVVLVATREIFELYAGRLGRPREAMPDLARIAHEYAGTRTGEWARDTLRRLKDEMRREREAGTAAPPSPRPD